MMILTGVDPEEGKKNPHIIVSEDGKAAVWAGVIDDLWELGKPVGHGGPWNDTQVASNEQSDPYLIAFYDRKEMKLSHKSSETVKFTVEVDPTGNGKWMTYAKYDVKPGETFTYQFPDGFQSRWIRFSVDKNCQAISFITLPVEINASQRALVWLSRAGITNVYTHDKAEDALKSAAYTYVVAALGSLASLMYYIMIFMGGSRDE